MPFGARVCISLVRLLVGAYVSTAQSTEWTLASVYVADMADLQVEWFCAQACFGEESAAAASGQWLPGAVTPEEQCWASSETICSVRLLPQPLALYPFHMSSLQHVRCALVVAGGDRRRGDAEGQ